ncbi:hypothetical protein DSO57_1019411 [Entomophthora muscae]|uniref:Uncharacterized protein n=1 Tax=Entomophthora muscae TaxID=34485 RepID=A0ACC2UQF7_9FUNG|nr:hypothetical protein DSO57_1019411 [Entomophthora muscae]
MSFPVLSAFETKTLSDELPHTGKKQQIINFPPFFTRQLNPSTWEAQVKFWQEIILADFRRRNDFILKPELLDLNPTHSSVAIFTNDRINRKVSKELLQEILDNLEKSGSVSKTASSKLGALEYLVWWRSREEWASEIFNWVQQAGAHNKVYLVADLLDDEEYSEARKYCTKLPLACGS